MKIKFIIVSILSALCLLIYPIISIINDSVDVYYFLYILFMIVGIFIFLIVHELGHLLFGLLSGYEFISFQFFTNIIFKDTDGKIRTEKRKNRAVLGQCIMKYPKKKNYNVIMYHVGGGILNLTFGLIFIVLYILYPNGFLGAIFMAFASVNLLFMVTNLFPLNYPTTNDGYNIYRYIKNKDVNKLYEEYLDISIDIRNNVEFKNLSLLEHISKSNEKEVFFANHLYHQFYKELDLFKFDEAKETLEELFKTHKEKKSNAYYACLFEKIYFYGIYMNNEVEIKKCYDEIPKKIKKSLFKLQINNYLKVAYVVAQYVEYNPNKAKKMKENYKKLVEKEFVANQVLMEKDLLMMHPFERKVNFVNNQEKIEKYSYASLNGYKIYFVNREMINEEINIEHEINSLFKDENTNYLDINGNIYIFEAILYKGKIIYDITELEMVKMEITE